MTTDAESKTKFDLGYFFTGEGLKDWYKSWGLGWRLALSVALLVFLGLGIRGCFIKQPANINKPHVVVLPGAKVEKVDQTSTQINVGPEKPWELGLTGGVFTYDNKNGAAGFVTIKRRF